MSMSEFTLVFRLPNASTCAELCMARLAALGCDDAVIGVPPMGCVALDFRREADSALEAISSAIADVKRAMPEAVLCKIASGVVELTELDGNAR